MGFRLNVAGVRELLNSPAMVAEMKRRVDKALAFAEATAPFRASDPPPHYNEQFEAEAHAGGGLHHDRAEGILRNTDPQSFRIEHGTGDTPAHRTLGRSIDAMRD